MANEHLKSLYTVLEQTTGLLRKNLNVSFLDAAIEAGEDLQTGVIKHEDGLPDATTTQQLEKQDQTIQLSNFSAEEIRQALQLLLVSAIRIDGIEPNKQVTPDAMAELATFMITTFIPHLPATVTVADPAVGSGNLLFAVMNAMKSTLKVKPMGAGIDNDDRLLAFASMSAAMQQLDVTLYHQDALATPPFNNVRVVVSDLPVGYSPLDERAKTFKTAAAEGHSYAHHLLIEQSLKLLAPGGLGLFFVPSDLFQSKEAATLTEWLAKATYFQGLLNLPKDFFASESARKAMLIIQRPGGQAVRAKQVLLGDFPALNDEEAFSQFLANVKTWAEENITEA